MLYKTHLATSIALGAGLATVTSYPFTIWYLGGISFGSLLPDIDEPNSYIGKRSFGIAKIINQKFGHRGITHSLLTWLSLTICLYTVFHGPFTLGVCLGYLFHITGDYFSKSGVPLFKPILNQRYKFFITYKTSSSAEAIIYIFAILLAVFIILDNQLITPLISSTADLLVKLIKILLDQIQK